jgi:hypothetical protein
MILRQSEPSLVIERLQAQFSDFSPDMLQFAYNWCEYLLGYVEFFYSLSLLHMLFDPDRAIESSFLLQ